MALKDLDTQPGAFNLKNPAEHRIIGSTGNPHVMRQLIDIANIKNIDTRREVREKARILLEFLNGFVDPSEYARANQARRWAHLIGPLMPIFSPIPGARVDDLCYAIEVPRLQDPKTGATANEWKVRVINPYCTEFTSPQDQEVALRRLDMVQIIPSMQGLFELLQRDALYTYRILRIKDEPVI